MENMVVTMVHRQHTDLWHQKGHAMRHRSILNSMGLLALVYIHDHLTLWPWGLLSSPQDLWRAHLWQDSDLRVVRHQHAHSTDPHLLGFVGLLGVPYGLLVGRALGEEFESPMPINKICESGINHARCAHPSPTNALIVAHHTSIYDNSYTYLPSVHWR